MKDILQKPKRERKKYIPILFQDLFLDVWEDLQGWKNITGQTAQPDSGYIGQHIASLITGIEGEGYKGKGNDLSDGSEVKTASTLSSTDRPRWNHRIVSDQDVEDWLDQPNIIYILIDKNTNDNIRLRVWVVDTASDDQYSQVVRDWHDEGYSSNNFQLHPPIGSPSDTARNDVGNVDLDREYELVIS